MPTVTPDASTPPEQPTAQADIVIVNFNGGERVAACVEACIGLESVAQIVVSDNGSVDGSVEELAKLATATPNLKLIENKQNLGFSRGNNRALPYLNAPYTLFLNPDTLLTQAALTAMLEFMETHPETGMAGPLILNDDGSEQRGCRRDEPTPIAALKTLVGKREKGINKVGTPLPPQPIDVDAISGACMLVRRTALDAVGPLDKDYFLHCEDLDWCKRFWQHGWCVTFVPQAVVQHHKGGSSRSRPLRVEWHKHKGMIRYYRKFYRQQYPAPIMWLVYSAVWLRFGLMIPVWWIKTER